MSELRVDRSRGQHFDWVLAIVVLMLMGMGLVNLVSAAASGVEGGSDIVSRQLTVVGRLRRLPRLIRSPLGKVHGAARVCSASSAVGSR